MEIKKIIVTLCLATAALCNAIETSSEAAKKLFYFFANKNEKKESLNVSDLLKKIDNKDLVNEKGETFWHVIAKRDDPEMNDFFVNLDNNESLFKLINKKDNLGHTALYYLAKGKYEKKHEVLVGFFSRGIILDLASAKHIVKDPDWKKKYSSCADQIIEVVSQVRFYYVASFLLGLTMPFFKNSLLNSLALYLAGAVADWWYVYHTHKRFTDELNRADLSATMFVLGAMTRHVFQRYFKVPVPQQWSSIKSSYPLLKPILHGTAFLLSLMWIKSFSVAL